MAKEIIYKEQLILEHSNKEKEFTYYLYDEDGYVNEYFAKSLEDAKSLIDEFYDRNKGFYNELGELYQ